MNDQLPPAVFFDIGNTLRSARFSSRLPRRLEGLSVYLQVRAVLQGLRDRSVRLGILLYGGQKTEENVRRVLEEAHLYNFFEPNLLVYVAKNSPDIVYRAADRAGHSANPERCLDVGEDRNEGGWVTYSFVICHC